MSLPMNRRFFLIIVGLLFFLTCFPAWAAQTTVVTPLGQVIGLESDGIRVFKGIPYAKPPTGELRFAPPQDAEPWPTPLNAENYGPRAVQISAPGGPPMSEDCLTLNIWAPANTKALLPVYVYIHGGGYAVGAGSDASYDGASFAKNGIVSITINYRLNVLGFFASRTTFDQYGATGNWGHLDQIKALEWIQKNIAAFGGDPDNVTIGGESAGSMSVSALILSPLAKGLFQGAILESGTMLGVPQGSYYAKGDLKRSIDLSRILALMFNAEDNAEGLAKLRRAEAAALAQLAEFRLNQTSLSPFFLVPVFDGKVIPEAPYQALKAGTFNKVRLLWGYNTDEGSLFVPQDADAAQYAAVATTAYGYDKAKILLERFPVDDENPAFQRTRELVAYCMFKVGMKIYGDALAKEGLDVYAYNFDYISPQDRQAGLGARHAAEIPYAFNTLPAVGLGAPEQQALADEMHARWINFIKTGNPNEGLSAPSKVAWPKYNPANPEILRLNTSVTVESLPDKGDYDFLEELTFGKTR